MATDVLTDCASKSTLDCASDRTSLRVATATGAKAKVPVMLPSGKAA
jgi:hypothetical protein